jgi:hypothetical protein
VDDDAVFSGVDGPRCPRAPANSPPRALLINKGSASGVFQDDFKNGEVQHSESPLPLGNLSLFAVRLYLDCSFGRMAGLAVYP